MSSTKITGKIVKFRRYRKTDTSIPYDILSRYPHDIVKKYVVAQCKNCGGPMKAVAFLKTGMKLGCSNCGQCILVNKNFMT